MANKEIQEKLGAYVQISKNIVSIQRRGIRESTELDELESRRKDLEADLQRMQINGRELEDPILDYCFRNLTPPLDKKRDVAAFALQVKQLKGQKILSVQGSKLETGVISGACTFSIADRGYFRQLHVPVHPGFKLDQSGSWFPNIGGIFVDPDIFQYPLQRVLGTALGGGIWRTDHSQAHYLGGSGPAETAIYLGDIYVQQGFAKHKQVEVKSTVRVSSPF